MIKRKRLPAILTLLCCTLALPAKGGVFRDVGYGLGLAGFDLIGSENPLSGGADFLIRRNFIGNPLDFGAWDLTLQGPLSASLSTGGRNLSQFDFSIRTAVDSRSVANPIAYALNYDVGGQATQITGTLLMDANFSLNGFGFYELDVTYSSRQDVANDGRFDVGNIENDFDLGPISISGNLFADALAFITNPLFERAGQPNLFASFSGQAQLEAIMGDAAARTRAELSSGDSMEDAFGVIASALILDGLTGGDPAAHIASIINEQGRSAAPVPEPAVLLLLLAGIPVMMNQSRRRRIAGCAA